MDDETTGKPDEAGPQQEGAGASPEQGGRADETALTRAWSGGAGPYDEPDDAPMPGEATRVMAGDTAGPTRVAPAGGAGTPPPRPPGPQPTLVMSSRPPREGSSTGWIVVVVILVAIAAAAAVWYFLIRDQGVQPAPSPTPTPTATVSFAWVGAWAPTDGSGGGLVLQKDADGYQVTVYDTMVRVLGSAVATEQGKDLAFALETSEALAGVPGPYDVVLSPGTGADEIRMSLTGSNGTTISMPLQRVPALVPVTPSSSPSPTATPSPTVSPTSSPSASPSPSPSTESQQVVDGIDRIEAGIMTWATDNNGLYPAPQDVTQNGGVAGSVDPWPTNPYSGQPMKPGTGPGEYIYEQLDGGTGYRLTGYVSGGLTYTVP